MRGSIVFPSLADAVRAGYQVYDRTEEGHLVRKRIADGWKLAIALVIPDMPAPERRHDAFEICGPESLLRDSHRETWIMTFSRPTLFVADRCNTGVERPTKTGRCASHWSRGSREAVAAFISIALAGAIYGAAFLIR
jgi:hypothetical protein